MDYQSQGTPLKYDPEYKGPVKNRSCTDIICCLIFIVFIGGLAVVAYFGFYYGDPRLLLYPVNSDKEMCGFGKFKDKPNLFFFDLVECGRMGVGIFVTGCPTPQVCVKDCPNENFLYKYDLNDNEADKLKFCKPGVVKTGKTVSELVKNDDCAAYYLKSTPLLHRCVPTALFSVLKLGGDLTSKINDELVNSSSIVTDKNGNNITHTEMSHGLSVFGTFLKAKEYGEKIVEDVVASWWMILVVLIIAMIISLIWIVLMRWLAGIMVWLTILIFIGLFGFSSAWCFKSYFETKDTDQEFNIRFVILNLNFAKYKLFLAFGIISGIILLITLLILLALCSRIRIAIALIKEGSRAVGSMSFTLLFPVIPFLLQISVIAFWLLLAVFLASTGRQQNFEIGNNSEYRFSNGSWDYTKIKTKTAQFFGAVCDDSDLQGNNTNEFCTFLKNQEENFAFYTQIYNLFMLFWLVNFFIALGQMTLAGAFSSYYWAFEKPKDIPSFPLLGAFGRCFRYHLGSLAFGSFIIAVIQIIRVLLEYLDSKLKGSENPVAKFFLKCLKCCFWCLEKFIRFLNKNAYIMIAVHGKNFCTSAKDAFMLLMRNIVRVVVVDKVTDFLIFIGKLVIVGAAATSSYFFFSGKISFVQEYNPRLNFYVVPIVLITLGSYVIASCFFSVYSMAVDTLFLCFLEDLERNDGSAAKPYFMSKELMKILGKKNKPKKTEE
ncbi:hypothetical protein KUTeg_022002 [Tegillarca granosa]|uniref:Choline transporter-like protein n=1 Tax=Tegillarca granosa TaxID=220873 RepID=A0ABQ9E4Z7_TEGGR|nr:hypothetical protein KUTeg_022002 [Tegillarca granosa]